MIDLSADLARRIAVAAQGLDDPRPVGRVDGRHLRRVLRRVGIIQIDSVTAVVRSQYLPAFSRLGAYPRDALDRAAAPGGWLYECWCHVASLAPVELQPLLRWRQAGAAAGGSPGMARFVEDQRAYIDEVLAEVAESGPITARQLRDPGVKQGPWWGRSPGKVALEYLFATGRTAAVRQGNFERAYDLPERVLPAEVLARPTPDEHDAHRELLAIAARSQGLATATDLSDYVRLRPPVARPRISELVEEGIVEEVRVEGWTKTAYLHRDARRPRRVSTAALLSPFDSMVWNRDRVARLFGFDYRIEIYVPEPERRHGYYVLPFLLDDHLVARVDLRADRANGVLRVPAVYFEDGVSQDEVVSRLAPALDDLAGWLGLDDVHPVVTA